MALTDTPGSTSWHPHDQGIDVYSVVPHHGGGDHPVAPVAPHPSGGTDQTKVFGTPNSNVQGPPSIDQVIRGRAESYRSSPNANLPAGQGGADMPSPDQVVRMRMPEEAGQVPGEGATFVGQNQSLAYRHPVMEGASVMAPNVADRQLSDAEIFSPALPVAQEGLAGQQIHTKEKDDYKNKLLQDAMPAGSNMAVPGKPKRP